ncbi:YncE family protein [Sphingomonas sp. BAUL-RG-20F-R05-02]|uniref:YncE family protein n=1 Tax=Sphingomonas sp. BAUL-RG-20F-R05-02 TaxID=2914830 RepID=UPI001F588ECB|nr:YncE family protein [Sphingomonas sp. BAUL-RG-20F-R05-02]
MAQRRWIRSVVGIGLLIATCGTMPVTARQILVSAEDGKPVRPGDTSAGVTPDLLRILALDSSGLRTLATIAVPASMTGPPESVKLTPDGHYAIVSASQAFDPDGAPPLSAGDAVSLVDLTIPARPRLIETVHAGAGASGVAVAPDGKRVLVANARANSVSAFAIIGGHLVAQGSVGFPAGSRPVSARFLPDSASALVVGGGGRIFRLAIGGGGMVVVPDTAEVGSGASGIALSPDGRTAYVAASRIASGGSETFVAAVDTATLHVTPGPALPPAAEGLALSRSGRFLEVTLLDGTNLPPADPQHHDAGTIVVLAVAGDTLQLVAQARTGRLCQGAAWSDDEHQIILQCADDRRIERYRFDGHASLQRVDQVLATTGRPGALATDAYR